MNERDWWWHPPERPDQAAVQLAILADLLTAQARSWGPPPHWRALETIADAIRGIAATLTDDKDNTHD